MEIDDGILTSQGLTAPNWFKSLASKARLLSDTYICKFIGRYSRFGPSGLGCGSIHKKEFIKWYYYYKYEEIIKQFYYYKYYIDRHVM